MFLEVESDENMLKARAIDGAFWRYKNFFSEVGTAEKMLKAKTQNDALWRCLERFLGSWNSWENFKIKDDV